MFDSVLNTPMQNDIVFSYGSVSFRYQSVCLCNISDESVFFKYQPGNSIIDSDQKKIIRKL